MAQSTQEEASDYQKSPEDCLFDADDKPSDIYQLVADKSVIRLKELAVRNEPVAQNGQEDGEPTQQQLAQWWLDYGITRKITKRNCTPLSNAPLPRTLTSSAFGEAITKGST